MRFVILSTPSLKMLADELNKMAIGSGRVIYVSKVGKAYEAMIDMYPTHVVTNDDLLFDIEENKRILSKLTLSA